MSDLTIFDALADPTRRNLVINLANGKPKTATELSKEYPITRPGIIKHLNILEKAGLVKIYQKFAEHNPAVSISITPFAIGKYAA